jgi:hypothetical protein
MKPSILFLIVILFSIINNKSFGQVSKIEKTKCACSKEKALLKGKQIAKRKMFWKHLVRKYKYSIKESYIYHPKGYWRIIISPKEKIKDGGTCIILSKYCNFFKLIKIC